MKFVSNNDLWLWSTASSITLKVKQLGSKSGKIYITRTSPGKLESNQTGVSYRAEK